MLILSSPPLEEGLRKLRVIFSLRLHVAGGGGVVRKGKEGASDPLSSKRKLIMRIIGNIGDSTKNAASEAHTWEPDVFLVTSEESVSSPHSWLEVTLSYISPLGPGFVICERRGPPEYAYLLPGYTLHPLVGVKQSHPASTPDKGFRSDSGCRIQKRLR